jgi:hypothetical protein
VSLVKKFRYRWTISMEAIPNEEYDTIILDKFDKETWFEYFC